MYPDRQTAIEELALTETFNPGKWADHSRNVALAAECIARACPGMDVEKAYVCGLLHDIGRRAGVFQVRHIIEGYDYCMSKGWDEVARICLTHSFPVKDIRADVGKKDITQEQYDFIDNYLNTLEYDDYDKLIILCDCLGTAEGLCILEKRMVDISRRYGIFDCTLPRWDKTFEYKEYFESKMGRSLYSVLPEIEKCIYL